MHSRFFFPARNLEHIEEETARWRCQIAFWALNDQRHKVRTEQSHGNAEDGHQLCAPNLCPERALVERGNDAPAGDELNHGDGERRSDEARRLEVLAFVGEPPRLGL